MIINTSAISSNSIWSSTCSRWAILTCRKNVEHEINNRRHDRYTTSPHWTMQPLNLLRNFNFKSWFCKSTFRLNIPVVHRTWRPFLHLHRCRTRQENAWLCLQRKRQVCCWGKYFEQKPSQNYSNSPTFWAIIMWIRKKNILPFSLS